MNKHRLTITVCLNATENYKLPLLVISKSQKPQALKSIKMASLPVRYKSKKSARIDEDISKDCFINEFIQKITKQLQSFKCICMRMKAFLVLDNASTHPEI